MSKLGIRWEIDRVPAAFITRGAVNGRYCVTFKRTEATPEQIDQINRASPALTRITESKGEMGLPVGYGFELTDPCCQHAGRIFIATLQTVQQYPRDVTAYQEAIQILNDTIQEHMVMADHQTNQMIAMVNNTELAYRPMDLPAGWDDLGPVFEVQA